MSVSSNTVSHMHPSFPYVDAGSPCLIPAEVDLTWAVSPLLYQWLMEFTSCTGVDICPTKLTVILQASDIGTKERSKLPTASCALAFVTHLVIQHIWLYLHLLEQNRNSSTYRLFLLKSYMRAFTFFWFKKKKKVVWNQTYEHFDLTNRLLLFTIYQL